MKYFLFVIAFIFICNDVISQCDVCKTLHLPETDKRVITTQEDVVVVNDEYTISLSPYYHETSRLDIYFQLISEPICIKKEDTYVKLITDNDSIIAIRHIGANNCRSDMIGLLSLDYVEYLSENPIKFISISNRGFNRTVELQHRHTKRLLKYFSCLLKEYPIVKGEEVSNDRSENVIELERNGSLCDGNLKDIFESNLSGVLSTMFVVCNDTLELSFNIDAINWDCIYPHDSVFIRFEDGIEIKRRNSKKEVECDGYFLYKGIDPFLIGYLSESLVSEIVIKSGNKEVVFNVSKANAAFIKAYAKCIFY